MLAKAKLTHLSIMKVNQQIIIYLYYFRTLLELYFFYTIIKNWSYVWNEMPVLPLITTCLSALLVTIGLTPHWTKVEAKRLYRQYSRKISFYDMPSLRKRTRLNNLRDFMEHNYYIIMHLCTYQFLQAYMYGSPLGIKLLT